MCRYFLQARHRTVFLRLSKEDHSIETYLNLSEYRHTLFLTEVCSSDKIFTIDRKQLKTACCRLTLNEDMMSNPLKTKPNQNYRQLFFPPLTPHYRKGLLFTHRYTQPLTKFSSAPIYTLLNTEILNRTITNTEKTSILLTLHRNENKA